MSAWARRLEVAAYASLFVSMLSHLGNAPPYNAALSLLMLFAHHTNRGRHIFVAMISVGFSLVLDPMYVGELSLANKWNIVPLVCVPLLALLKVLCLVSCWKIFVGLGGTWSLTETSIPVEDGWDGAPSPSNHRPLSSASGRQASHSFGVVDGRGFSVNVEERGGVK